MGIVTEEEEKQKRIAAKAYEGGGGQKRVATEDAERQRMLGVLTEDLCTAATNHCKFHPTAEAIARCAKCGAEMCSECDKGAFYRLKSEPWCLNCSLKVMEELLKTDKKDGIISFIIWLIGVCLIQVIGEASFLVMLFAAVFFFKTALFTSDEKGFFEKIKDIFLRIIICAVLLPAYVLYVIITTKRDIKKIKKALGIVN